MPINLYEKTSHFNLIQLFLNLTETNFMAKLSYLVFFMCLGSHLYSQSEGVRFYQSHLIFIHQKIAKHRGYCETAKTYSSQFVSNYRGDHAKYWKQHSIDNLADCKESNVPKSRVIYSSNKIRIPAPLKPGSKTYERITSDSIILAKANIHFKKPEMKSGKHENLLTQKEEEAKRILDQDKNSLKPNELYTNNTKNERANSNHVLNNKNKDSLTERENQLVKTKILNKETKALDSKPSINQSEMLELGEALHFRILFTKSTNPDLSFLSLSSIGPVYSEYHAQSKLYHYYLGHYSTIDEAKQVGATLSVSPYHLAQIEKINLGKIEAVYPVSALENKEMTPAAPFIVVGSFIDPIKAEKVFQKIKENGYLAKTELYNGHHRVGLIYEGSSDSLELFLEQIRIKFNKDAWIRK